MATTPSTKTLSADASQILNAIRTNATADYRDYVPVAYPSDESVRQIGTVIMQMQALQNTFLSTLVNRIGMVMFSSKMFSNPWAVFKKGNLDFGETIEEIFVNLAQPYTYDPVVSESEVFKREVPDVRSAFHYLNYQTMYKCTVSQAQLKQAFTSMQGVTDLINYVVQSMYSAANYDEFLVMKYNVARHILAGHLKAIEIPAEPATNAHATVTSIKGTSNLMEFPSGEYNLAGVKTAAMKEEQYLVCTADFDAAMDVNVLASAFNMDKAEFAGHRISVDSFASFDFNRLGTLLGQDPSYEPFTDAELEALAAVPAVLISRDWMQVYDQEPEFSEIYNPQGRYWNYFFHTWKVVSMSPFNNGAVFVPGTAPAVTSVSLSPSTATVYKGQLLQLTATVATEGFAPQSVKYTLDDDAKAVVSSTGMVTVADDASGTITVTATSTYDATKTATAKLTVASV